MDDDCKRRLEELESRVASNENDIQLLQVGAAAKDEQIKTIFSILAEIKQMLREYTVEMKGAIDRLSKDIEKVKERPGRFADGALSSAIAAIIGAAIMYFVQGGGK